MEDCIFKKVGIANSTVCPGLGAEAKDGKKSVRTMSKEKSSDAVPWMQWLCSVTSFCGWEKAVVF